MARSTTIEITPLVRAIHTELRGLIAQRSLSQYRLRDKSGVSQSTISKTIYRDTSTLNLSQLEKIANALGEKPSQIIARAERTAEREQQQQHAYANDPEIQALIAQSQQLRKDGYALAAKRGDPETGGNWG